MATFPRLIDVSVSSSSHRKRSLSSSPGPLPRCTLVFLLFLVSLVVVYCAEEDDIISTTTTLTAPLEATATTDSALSLDGTIGLFVIPRETVNFDVFPYLQLLLMKRPPERCHSQRLRMRRRNGLKVRNLQLSRWTRSIAMRVKRLLQSVQAQTLIRQPKKEMKWRVTH